jgi:preprotein translocase subunit SecG
MIYYLLVILIVLASLLMIGVVLIQESKGGGLASNFSSSNSIMGVRKTTDIVEKTTWTLAAIMVVLSVFCAYTAPQAVTDQSVMEQAATENATTNPTNTQGFGTGQQQTPAADAQKAAPAQQQKAPVAPKAQPAK